MFQISSKENRKTWQYCSRWSSSCLTENLERSNFLLAGGIPRTARPERKTNSQYLEGINLHIIQFATKRDLIHLKVKIDQYRVFPLKKGNLEILRNFPITFVKVKMCKRKNKMNQWNEGINGMFRNETNKEEQTPTELKMESIMWGTFMSEFINELQENWKESRICRKTRSRMCSCT